MKHPDIHVVKEHVVKEQVVGTASLLKNGNHNKQPQQTRGSRPSERGDPLHAGAVERHSPPAPG